MRILIRDAEDHELSVVEAREMLKYTGEPKESIDIWPVSEPGFHYECYDWRLLQPNSFELSQCFMHVLKDGYVDMSDYLWEYINDDNEEDNEPNENT